MFVIFVLSRNFEGFDEKAGTKEFAENKRISQSFAFPKFLRTKAENVHSLQFNMPVFLFEKIVQICLAYAW